MEKKHPTDDTASSPKRQRLCEFRDAFSQQDMSTIFSCLLDHLTLLEIDTLLGVATFVRPLVLAYDLQSRLRQERKQLGGHGTDLFYRVYQHYHAAFELHASAVIGLSTLDRTIRKLNKLLPSEWNLCAAPRAFTHAQRNSYPSTYIYVHMLHTSLVNGVRVFQECFNGILADVRLEDFECFNWNARKFIYQRLIECGFDLSHALCGLACSNRNPLLVQRLVSLNPPANLPMTIAAQNNPPDYGQNNAAIANLPTLSNPRVARYVLTTSWNNWNQRFVFAFCRTPIEILEEIKIGEFILKTTKAKYLSEIQSTQQFFDCLLQLPCFQTVLSLYLPLIGAERLLVPHVEIFHRTAIRHYVFDSTNISLLCTYLPICKRHDPDRYSAYMSGPFRLLPIETRAQIVDIIFHLVEPDIEYLFVKRSENLPTRKIRHNPILAFYALQSLLVQGGRDLD